MLSAGTRMHQSLALTHSCFLEGSPWFPICSSVLKRQLLFLPLLESVPGEEAADMSCSEKIGFSVQDFRCPERVDVAAPV